MAVDNSPLRVIFVGPLADGSRLAARLRDVCARRGHAPEICVRARLTKRQERRLYEILGPTALITFGADGQSVYDYVAQRHPWVRLLRLLAPGEPEGEFCFSDKRQTIPWPETEHDMEVIASWLGFRAREGGGEASVSRARQLHGYTKMLPQRSIKTIHPRGYT